MFDFSEFGWTPIMTAVGLVTALLLTTIWHELGHLLVARLLRVPVKLVAIGLGPALWRRTIRGDVRLELRAVPLGMAIGVVGRRAPDGHARRPITHDLAVAAGGPLASFLLTALLIAAVFLLRPIFPIAPVHPVQVWLAATALLSTFLAAMNLIPMPGLDGGHLVMLGLAHLGWQLSPQREVAVMRLGIRLTAALTVLTAAFLALRHV